MTSESLKDLKVLLTLDRIREFDSKDISISVNSIYLISKVGRYRYRYEILLEFMNIEGYISPNRIDIHMRSPYIDDIDDYKIPIVFDMFKSDIEEDEIEMGIDMYIGREELDWKRYLKFNSIKLE